MKKIKYLFLIMLATFMSVSFVSAEEYNTCYDEFKIADSLTFNFSNQYNYSVRMTVNLPVKANTMLYLKFWNLDLTKTYEVNPNMYTYFYDADGNKLNTDGRFSGTMSKMSDTGVITYTYNGSLENASYFHMNFYVNSSGTITYPNKTSILTVSEYELTTCPVVEEPEPEPEPEPIIPDITLDNFYSIYVTKLKEFSQYSFENKYILGTLSIILLFIILEIILNLFGRRKL